MPTPSPEDFWKLVAASRLLAADVLSGLRRDYEAEAATQPAPATAEAATTAVAKWLVKRGSLTKWQGRRLLAGDSGPFFIGDYRLLDRLEAEGAGRLFRARHEPTGRSVGLLVLDPRLCQRVDVWTEIVRRATIAHDATDPALSRTWALEQVQGNRILVCEDVEGPTLADELVRLGPLPSPLACEVMLPIFRAAGELHRRGAVHGSISLDSIRVEPAGGGNGGQGSVDALGGPGGRRVRLLQIPLAGDPHAVSTQPLVDSTDRIARLGRRASFVAPELMLPGRVCDRRSDVYSLGCVLHALLTGRAPCWQGDAQRTLSQAAFVGPEPLGPPRVPVELATLVSYLVSREPASRYPDAAEAADALAACMGLPPVSVSLPPPQQPAVGAAAPEPAAAAVDTVAFDPAAQLAGVAAAQPGAPQLTTSGSSAVERATRAARKRAERLRWIGAGLATGVAALALAVALFRGGGTESRPAGDREADTAGDTSSGTGTDTTATASDGDTARATAKPAAGATAKPAGSTTAKPAADKTAQTPSAANGKPAGPEAMAVSTPEPAPPAEAARPAGPRVSIIDSPDLPWAAPTSGRPPTLAYLPPGSQLMLLARPAAIVADDEGRQFVRSLGPRVEAGVAELEKLSGRGLADVEELLAGWQAGTADLGGGDVVGGWTLRFAEPLDLADDEDARGRAWGETRAVQVGDETIHVGGRLAYWMPAAEQGRVLAIGPEPLLRATVAAGPPADDAGLQASLPQDLEQLVGMLDRSRHLTLLGSPQYLLTDGRAVLAGPLARLVEPLGEFFGDGVRAAAVSLHFGDNFYAEVDAIASRERPAPALARHLKERIDGLGDVVVDYCAAVEPHPYGRKLIMRLPAMINALADNARSGPEGKGAVLNTYLPRHAAHNLVLAGELALEQAPGEVAVAATGGPARGGKPAAGAAAASTGALASLQKKISLVFAKDTLEKSIQMLADEVGVPMDILGGDLQLEGITKNQSFGLEERDKTADAVLRTILARSDPAGRLVYVVRVRDGQESIEVTTRAAVEKRGDKLPPGFEAKPAGTEGKK